MTIDEFRDALAREAAALGFEDDWVGWGWMRFRPGWRPMAEADRKARAEDRRKSKGESEATRRPTAGRWGCHRYP